jgi:hydroxyacylglutathione hydrolase
MTKVIPFVREGLGNSSYLVQVGEKEAALVDPDRSVDRYLKAAQERGWQIISIFETHLHADFVSGAREVAHRTAAKLYAPAQAQLRFPHKPVEEGQKVQTGSVHVEVVASPGHTPEHLSYVFFPERQPPALFSGGALIVGGAARTDLISPQMTEPLTRAAFKTLHTAFSSLGDETVLYPTHGGGSFCSAGGGSKRVSTLGEERAQNPLLSIKDEEEFARWFPSTFPPGVPDYFYRMRPINQAGPRLRREIAVAPGLSPAQFAKAQTGALVLDVRLYGEYAEAHVPGSISNAFRAGYATFLGWVVPPNIPLLLVTGSVPLEQVIEESLLVGYEHFAGFLEGGMAAWKSDGLPVQHMEVVDARQAHKALLNGAAALDVREPGEYASGHIQGAIHIPLGKLQTRLGDVPRDCPIVAYCAAGLRSATALSILERAGYRDLLNLAGGAGAWRDSGRELVLI